MICAQCFCPNDPTRTHCQKCGAFIKSAEEAAQSKDMLERLPPQTREEMEKKYKTELTEYQAYFESLKRNRKKHIILGAVLGFLIGMISYLPGIPMPWKLGYMVLSLVTGGTAACLLNTHYGGRFTGMLLFSGGFFIILIIEIIHLFISGVDPLALFAIWFWDGFRGLIPSMAIGYCWGLKLEFKGFFE
ncbi:MAG: hypothetical protein V1701_07775 [Planctomycetota bacterium]